MSLFQDANMKSLIKNYKEMERKGHVDRSGGGISLKSAITQNVYFINVEGRDDQLRVEHIVSPTAITDAIANECIPLFNGSFWNTSSAVIHSHSVHSVIASQWQQAKFGGYHMSKYIYDVKTKNYLDPYAEFDVPIINGLLDELGEKLAESFESNSAVLVRGHGLYLHSKTIDDAMTQLEMYEKNFEIRCISRHQ